MAGPRHATNTARGGRLYVHPVTGETATSVTTVLSGGVPKPAIPRWAAKTAAEYVAANINELASLAKTGRQGRSEIIDRVKGAPWRQRDTKADIGTAVHDVAEKMALDPDTPIEISDYDGELHGYLEALVRWHRDWRPEILSSEATVWSRQYGYAGTLDLICRIDIPDRDEYGKWAGTRPCMLLDYKTSKGVYGETALQLAAYEKADFVLLDDGTEAEIPRPIDLMGVVHLRPAGSYGFHPVEVSERWWHCFLWANEIARFSNEDSKTAIGDPLKPPDMQPTLQEASTPDDDETGSTGPSLLPPPPA